MRALWHQYEELGKGGTEATPWGLWLCELVAACERLHGVQKGATETPRALLFRGWQACVKSQTDYPVKHVAAYKDFMEGLVFELYRHRKHKGKSEPFLKEEEEEWWVEPKEEGAAEADGHKEEPPPPPVEPKLAELQRQAEMAQAAVEKEVRAMQERQEARERELEQKRKEEERRGEEEERRGAEEERRGAEEERA